MYLCSVIFILLNIGLNLHKIHINAQGPHPSSSGGGCERGASCTFLGRCSQILDIVRQDQSAVSRYHCGSGPDGIHVCCPNNGGPSGDLQQVMLTPRPSPPSSGGRCERGSTCIFLGACPHILSIVRKDHSAVSRYHCGSGSDGIHVCCPSNGGTSGGGEQATPRPLPPPPPRPSPPPSSGSCKSGSTCIFLGLCRHIIEEVKKDQSAISRYHCGSGPDGIHVCCPNNGALPATTTPVSNRVPGLPNQGGSPGTGNLLPEPPLCGVTSSDERIFGGKPVPIGAYPWMAALGYSSQGSSGITFECAGSVINNRYVLTAAHCLDPEELEDRRLAVLHLGDWDLSTPTDCQKKGLSPPKCYGPHVVAGFEETISHPLYNIRSHHSDDIALIRLDRKLDFSNLNTAPIAPVCLPNRGFDAKATADGRRAVAAGWGFTEKNTKSNILLRVALPIAEPDRCRNFFGQRFQDKQLCVGGIIGKDSCNGDSGGPLLLAGPRGPPYLQIGIVSYGILGCGRTEIPAVYTEVSQFRDWIEQNLRP